MKKEIEYLQKKIKAIEHYIGGHYINGEYTGEYYPNISLFIFYFIVILIYLFLFYSVISIVSFKEIAEKITTLDFIFIFMSLFVILFMFSATLLLDIIPDFKCYLAYKYFCKIFNIKNKEKNLFEIFEQAKEEIALLMKIEKYPEEKIAKIYTSNHDCYANNNDNNNNQTLDICIEVNLKK